MRQDDRVRSSFPSPYECMNCGVARTPGDGMLGCQDELGQSCRAPRVGQSVMAVCDLRVLGTSRTFPAGTAGTVEHVSDSGAVTVRWFGVAGPIVYDGAGLTLLARGGVR